MHLIIDSPKETVVSIFFFFFYLCFLLTYNRAAARRCSRALKVNTKYIEEAEEEKVDELASQEQSPAKKRRRVRVSRTCCSTEITHLL